MKMTKHAPATIVVLLVLVFSFALTTGTAVVRFRNTYASFMEYSHERYSKAIREHLSASLINARSAAFALEGSDKFAALYEAGDRDGMLNYLRPLCAEFNISYVNIVDKNGDIVLRSYMPDDYRHDSIYYQSGVQNALAGERFSCFEKATIVKASARATAPIWKGDEVIGAVVAVFRFDTNEWADALKDRYGIDVSIFSEEEGCIATTIEINGARGVGEPLTAAAKEATCAEGRQFSEHAKLFGTLYNSVYIPIQNPQGGTFVVLCVSMPSSGLFNETVSFTLICGSVAALALAVTAFVLARQTYRINRSKKELAAALEEANRANTAKSDFLARMSHEIRTPLNAVIGMTELILRENISDSVRRDATLAKHAGKSLLEIINDILDISKIESGKMELVCTDYDVASVVADVAAMTRVRAGEKPIEIVTQIKPNFPAVMYGDETRVRQILMNLMSNAVKYTNEGTITLYGAFVFDSFGPNRSGHAIFSVRDTGIGIKEEDVGKLFAVFSQVDAQTNRKVEGTGLGLAITKNLAEMMRGGVSIESEYGKGSVFTVRIRQQINGYRPIGDAPVAAAAFERKPRKHGGAFRAPSASILVVDDVEANLLVVSGLLAPYGLNIDTAVSGGEAIEKVSQNSYDFVLMDHMMPGMDGVEATRQIRLIQDGRYKELPIIALTANAVTGMREMFLENGFSGFISKPIDVKELGAVMDKWVPEGKRVPIDADAAPADNPTAPPESGFACESLDAVGGLARCGGKIGVYGKVLRAFGAALTRQIEALRRIEAEEDFADFDGFAERMHTLKGSSANVGANGVFEVTKQLEAAAKSGDAGFIKAHIPALIFACEGVLRDIDGFGDIQPTV